MRLAALVLFSALAPAQAPVARVSCIAPYYCSSMSAGDDDVYYLAGSATPDSPVLGCRRGIYLARYRISSPDPEWVECVTDHQEESVAALVTGRDGKLYLGGTTVPQQLWLARFDPVARSFDYFRILDVPDLSLAGDLALDGLGRVFVVAWNARIPFLARFPAAGGDAEWSAGLEDSGWRLAGGPDGRVVAVSDSGIVRQFSPDGAIEWQLRLDGESVIRAAVTPSGEVWVASTSNRYEPDAPPLGTALARYQDGAWTPGLEGLAASTVLALIPNPASPAALWAVTQNGIFRSDTNGKTWALRSPASGPIGALALDPAQPGTLYASSNGIWKSSDTGLTWRPVLEGNYSSISADQLRPGTVYAAGASSQRSRDGGATWTPIFDQPLLNLFADTAVPGVLYGYFNVFIGGPGNVAGPGFTFSSLSRTTDDGATWTATTFDGWIMQAAQDPSRPGVVYLLTSRALYRSVDSGATWTAPLTLGNSRALAVSTADPAAVYILTGDGAILRFDGTTGGVSSIAASGPIAQAQALAIGEDRVLVAGGYAGTDIALRKYSSAGELLWSRRIGTPQMDSAVALALDAHGNLAVTGKSDRQTLFGRLDANAEVRLELLSLAPLSYGLSLAPRPAGGWLLGAFGVFDTPPSSERLVLELR